MNMNGRAVRTLAAAFALTVAGLVATAAAQTAPLSPDVGPALPATAWTSIKRVIADQLAALRGGDAARAFSFAATGIRDQFDDAPAFLSMVEQRYGALLTARYTEFLEGAVIDGHTIQPLRLVMGDDTVLVALYEMQRDPVGGWRIAGCVIAPSTVRST